MTAAIREAKVRNMAAARSVFQRLLPSRFAARWLDLHAPSDWTNQRWRNLTARRMNGLCARGNGRI